MLEKKRRYEDGCAFAQALDLIGERWALLVIRELVFGPKRFGDLKASLPGIAPNVLTQRLTDLEAAGIVRRKVLPPPARVQVYALTDWGAEIAPLFRVLGKWAARNPHLHFGWPLSVNGSVLAMTSMFDATRAGDLRAALEFRFNGEVFRADLADGRLDIVPGPHPAPQAVVAGDPNLFLPCLFAGQPLAAAEAAGLEVSGDRAVLARFAGLFPMPEPAPLPG